MKTELKHLAPYLSYGLETDKGLFWAICRTPLIKTKLKDGEIVKGTIESIKPILRPLSDLAKEIEVNRVVFIPIVELARIEWGGDVSDVCNEISEEDTYSIDLEYIPSWFTLTFNKQNKNFERWDDGNGNSACKNELMFKLFEWHFDVFGLIDKGLAIDINTLNQ